MPRYSITESVGRHVQTVHSFADLEKHHPSSGRQSGREYETINGELEEVRHRGGHTFIKKDFILSQDTPGPVNIPAPVGGYVHYMHDDTNTVRIYDQPFGTPGATMQAQVLHVRSGNNVLSDGAHVKYGQALGQMGDTGSSGSIHAHVEAELGQFQRYISDINSGVIQPGVTPAASGEPAHVNSAQPDALLKEGARGAAIETLQNHLIQLGYTDAQGQPLVADSNFGPNTRHAVEAFQRDHHLSVDGKVGPDTSGAFDRALADPAMLSFADPRHPDHAMYQQGLTFVKAVDAAMGRASDIQSVNLAGHWCQRPKPTALRVSTRCV